jgi:hypothetical protein
MIGLPKPKLNEHWTIEYGLNKKTRHIVKVLEDKELELPNWRVHSFKCRHDDGKELQVSGECFIEKWY